MRWGGDWHTPDNRRPRREGTDAQSSIHFGQSRLHACQADAVVPRRGKRLAGNADAIVGNHEMRGGAAEVELEAHPGRMRMAMDVG